MEHPITPPPELVRQWCAHSNEHENYDQFWRHIATQAARWGADQELEACCEWLDDDDDRATLRAARRPKPPSLREQALAEMELLESHGVHACCLGTLRRALESLPDPQD